MNNMCNNRYTPLIFDAYITKMWDVKLNLKDLAEA